MSITTIHASFLAIFSCFEPIFIATASCINKTNTTADCSIEIETLHCKIHLILFMYATILLSKQFPPCLQFQQSLKLSIQS